jgi:hypothetical protein
MKKYAIYIFIFLPVITACHKKDDNLTRQAWSELCINSETNSLPRIKIDSPVVQAALNRIKQVDPKSGIFTGKEFEYFYKLKPSDPESFLSAICGSYKDKPDMIKAYFQLFAGIHAVREGKQKYTPGDPLWPQLTGEGYRQLLFISKNLARFRSIPQPDPTMPATRSPPPLRVCEMRYIFKEYLANYRGVWTEDDYDRYKTGLIKFLESAEKTKECTTDELESYVDFRGDGLLRPFGPEAQTMRLTAKLFLKDCKSETEASLSDRLTSADCKSYFEHPFQTRYDAAIKTFRAMMFYNKDYDLYFRGPRYPLFITEDFDKDGVSDILTINSDYPGWKENILEPINQLSNVFLGNAFLKKDEISALRENVINMLNEGVSGKSGKIISVQNNMWRKIYTDSPDQGLFDIFSIDTREGTEEIKRRLEVLFNRHSDFYRTFLYDSRANFLADTNSPISSSSYYLNQSHKFTFKGFSRDRIEEPVMQWLYIYKIKKENYYSGYDIKAAKKPDFKADWLNERDFSSHDLATEELSLNKLAAPEASEFDALLWLGDVKVTSEVLDLARTTVR